MLRLDAVHLMQSLAEADKTPAQNIYVINVISPPCPSMISNKLKNDKGRLCQVCVRDVPSLCGIEQP